MENNMSNLENAEMHQVQDQPETASEQKAESEFINSEEINTGESQSHIDSESMSYDEAIVLPIDEPDPKYGPVISVRPALGNRDRFLPNEDRNRPVKLFLPHLGWDYLNAKRTGAEKSQGVFVDGKQIVRTFGVGAMDFEHLTQMVVQLADGREVIGYLRKTAKAKTGMYIPIRLIPEFGEMLTSGNVLIMMVGKLVVG